MYCSYHLWNIDAFPSLELHIKEFLEYYREHFPNSTILPKMHLLEDHTVEWLKQYNMGAVNKGLKAFTPTWNVWKGHTQACQTNSRDWNNIYLKYQLETVPSLQAQHHHLNRLHHSYLWLTSIYFNLYSSSLVECSPARKNDPNLEHSSSAIASIGLCKHLELDSSSTSRPLSRPVKSSYLGNSLSVHI